VKTPHRDNEHRRGAPGIGIQILRGPHAGRILMPFNQGAVWEKWKVYGRHQRRPRRDMALRRDTARGDHARPRRMKCSFAELGRRHRPPQRPATKAAHASAKSRAARTAGETWDRPLAEGRRAPPDPRLPSEHSPRRQRPLFLKPRERQKLATQTGTPPRQPSTTARPWPHHPRHLPRQLRLQLPRARLPSATWACLFRARRETSESPSSASHSAG